MNWEMIPIRMAEFLRRCFPCLTALIVTLTGASGSVMFLAGDEAIQATRRQYVYDNDRLLLGAYCFDPGDASSAQVGYIKEAGLDFVVGGYPTEAYLDECARQGIGVIGSGYNLPSAYGNIAQSTADAWQTLTQAGYKAHPALWGDDMIDEPNAAQFGKMAGMLDSYDQLNTQRLPYINLFPMYANNEQLGNDPEISTAIQLLLPSSDYADPQVDEYKRHVADYLRTLDTDYISVDIYPLHGEIRADGAAAKTESSRSWLRNLDILAEACRDTGRDLWVITQAAGNLYGVTDPGSMRYCDETSDQLQQDYAALAFGAKAIIYACYQGGWWDEASHMLSNAGARQATYYAVQAANAQIRPFAQLYGQYDYRGTYAVNRTRVAGLKYDLYNGLPQSEQLKLQSKNGLLVGCFQAKTGGGKAYVIANLEELGEETTAALTVNFPAGKEVKVYGGGTVKTYSDGGKVNFSLAPGDGRFVTVGE
ncbi:MAG: hypothetical protein LBJ11_00225 [Oscillospiraceae bacterium]|jgi:hypothetical protein|nr:hypothetical protein [Oscillospiraceae bacterium]